MPVGIWARFIGEAGDAYTRTFEALPGQIVEGAAKASTNAYWSFQGGPWIARYKRFALLAALGFGRDVEHHYDDPHDALAFFDTLPKRYRRPGSILRDSCLVTYKDDMGGAGGWYAVQPFASTASEDIDRMIREVAGDEGRSERRYGTHRRSADPPPRRFAGRTRKGRRSSSGGATSGGMTDREMYDHFMGEAGQ